MLRQFVKDGARTALRARTPAARGRSAPLLQPAFQSSTAAVPSKKSFKEFKAEREALTDSMTVKERVEWYAAQPLFDAPKFNDFVQKTGLSHPKRWGPLAVLMAAPLYSLGVFHVDDELLLFGCFILFVGCVVDVAGPPINQMLEDEMAKDLKEFNDYEMVEIKQLTADLEENKSKLSAKEDIEEVYKAKCYAEEREAEMLALMERHQHREKTVKMLDAFKAGRMKRIMEMRSAEVDKALAEIVSKVESDKKLKKTALDNALTTLGNPEAGAGVDPVSEMFLQYWKDVKTEMEKKKDQPVKITAEEKEKSEADIKAIFAKFGGDPTDYIKGLPDTYKPSDPNMLC